MARRFNITGLCNPDKHYMADVSGKISQIEAMIKDGNYFIINRPHQYGKTTTLMLLERTLLKDGQFFPIKISFESIDTTIYENHKRFIETFLTMLKNEFVDHGKQALVALIEEEMFSVENFFQMGELLSKVNGFEKPIVLMIDEMDSASNNQLFLDFLAMLRQKYLRMIEGKEKTFHSVVLVGVHDIKTLKLKIRPDEEHKYNSPWNIAASFDVDMDFSLEEISSLLTQYSRDKGVDIDIPAAVERLHYYTSGYPFLISYICKLLDEKIIPAKHKEQQQTWTLADIEAAVNLLLKENNTNFESLIKNLENNPDLYDFIKSIAVEGETISYHITDNLISLAKTYGIIGEEKGNCVIHNKIYGQLIYDHMTLKLVRQRKVERISQYNAASQFINNDGNLDFEKVLLKFQEFMKEQYSEKDRLFLERNGRLVFQAFLKPIINGTGFDFKEAQISEERRMDVVVTWGNKKYVIELKIWRGPEAHKKGLMQLADYLLRTNLPKGYLIIFDAMKSKEKNWERMTEKINDKEIFIVKV